MHQVVAHTHNNYLVSAGDITLYGASYNGYKVASQEYECTTCTNELQISNSALYLGFLAFQPLDNGNPDKKFTFLI